MWWLWYLYCISITDINMHDEDISETERKLWEAEHPGRDYDEYINSLIDEDLDMRE